MRIRAIGEDMALHVSNAGEFFASGEGYLDRLLDNNLSETDCAFLETTGNLSSAKSELAVTSRQYNLAQRLSRTSELDYLILVPTLRCNLSCSYCQVSRVTENAKGYDWSQETLDAVLKFIEQMSTNHIKIEFQGGEPTIRPDLIRRIIEACARFEHKQFVICTNLQVVTDELWAIFDNKDVYLSTSLDGTVLTHKEQRTGAGTQAFVSNLEAVIERYGHDKVSALPTIDPQTPPPIDEVLQTYLGFGLNSIFLRPINYQGFARKRHAYSRDSDEKWQNYHRSFIEKIIEVNWNDRSRVIEETYFSICLRRVFQPNADRHVDLRNPNPMAVDYLVIDHDGVIYPTDEARMLGRSGVIDLALCKVGEDWRTQKWAQLNAHSSNLFDQSCERCAYQPYCGKDVVDDLARYGTIDLDRTETAFCRKHLSLFDFIFELIYRRDERVNYSFSRWLRMDGTAEFFGSYLT